MFKKIPKGYGLNECPPLREAIALGFTHLPVLLLNTVPIPLLIGGGIGLPASEITILIAACLFVAGIASILQSIGAGPVGARLPVFLGNSFVFVAPGIAIAAQHGLDTFTGACLVGSVVCLIVWGGLYKQIAKLVKPYISGTIVAILGISLCGVAIGYCAGGTGSADYGSLSNYLLAGGTILLTLFLQRFTKGLLQKCAALVSMVVMTAVYGFMGKLDFSEMIQSAWLRVPQPLHFGIRFELGTIVTVSFLCLVALLELLGDQTTAANLAENRLPTGKEQHGGILAQGISSVFGSLFNLCPTISISANLGLCGLTGVTSRFVIAITGVLVMLCGICPKICAVFTQRGARRRGADDLRRHHPLGHQHPQELRNGQPRNHDRGNFAGGRHRVQRGGGQPRGLPLLGHLDAQRPAGHRHHRHPAQRPDPRRKEGERHRIRIGGSS